MPEFYCRIVISAFREHLLRSFRTLAKANAKLRLILGAWGVLLVIDWLSLDMDSIILGGRANYIVGTLVKGTMGWVNNFVLEFGGSRIFNS